MKKYRKTFIVIVLILLVVVAYVNLDFLHSKNALSQFLSANKTNGDIIFILIGIFVTTLCIPVSWMRIIGAIKFNFSKAVMTNFVIEVISAIILFAFVRWVAKENVDTYVKKWANKKNIDLNKFQQKLDKHGMLYVALLRNIPVIPFFTCNVILALSSISFKRYIEGSIMGSIIDIVINVFMYCKFVQYRGQSHIIIILAIILILYYIVVAYIGKKIIDTIKR